MIRCSDEDDNFSKTASTRAHWCVGVYSLWYQTFSPTFCKIVSTVCFFVVVCDFGVRMRIGFEGFERVTQRCYTTEMGFVYCIWGLTDSCVAEAQQEPSCVGVEESKVGRLVWFLCYVCVLVVYQHQKHCVCVCFIVWVCVCGF